MRGWFMIGAALGVWTAAAIAAADDAAPELWLISYEAIPSAQVALNLDGATYAERAELTAAAAGSISPKVIAAVGLDPAAIETDITPGGYLLATNASLQARGRLREDEAIRLAAALGYVYRQWSVLVSRLDETSGETGYVRVAFPDDALTPVSAQAFFEAAAAVNGGLGGGYTAFGDEMIFLNVRDPAHQPYSELDDVAFAAYLGQAAGAFDGEPLRIAGAGYARALFVGNDWDTAPQGEDYAEALGDAAPLDALNALRAAHTALSEEMGLRFGWR